MTRLASLISFLALFQILHLVNGYRSSSARLVVHSDLNKVLHGHSFLNFSGMTMENCLERCLANCLCLSFQVCANTPVSCQLCSSNKYLKPEAMRESKGCTSFNFGNQYEESNQQCGQNCMSVINCCLISNPCLNGGTCLPPLPSNRKRFTCKCPVGYKGERCEDKQCEPGYTGEQCDQPIRSCRGYSNGGRVPGNYIVLDIAMEPFKVFCDFNGKSSAWTLIQSYKLQNKLKFQFPLFENVPVNQNDPSWFHYRLSKSRMESIEHDSGKWRLTCRYDTDGVVYTDYVRAAKEEMNILTFNDSGSCVKMEYIDVRGQNCTDCTAYWTQDFVMPYFDSYYAPLRKCDFNPFNGSFSCEDFGEDNFGFYACCNPQHRCSSSSEATTQTWLGGDDKTVYAPHPATTHGRLLHTDE